MPAMAEELNEVGGTIHYRYGDEIKIRSFLPRSSTEGEHRINVITTHVTEADGFLRIERLTEWFDTEKDTDVHRICDTEYISLNSIVQVKISRSMGGLEEILNADRTEKEE